MSAHPGHRDQRQPDTMTTFEDINHHWSDPTRTRAVRRALVAFGLTAATVAGGAGFSPSVASAAPPGSEYSDHCWFVADGSNGTSSDWMSDYDLTSDGETTATVGTATTRMEAIAFHYPTAQLFATDHGQFGVINLTPGATYGEFTPIGSGGLGDVDGLSFDSTTGIMWGTKRNTGSVADTLFRIDFVTGTQVGPNIPIAPTVYSGPLNGSGSTTLYDIDDLAIDPVSGAFYAIANGSGSLDMLVIIDPTDGSTTAVGSPAESGIQDIEGLGFTPAGDLIGTAGTGGGASANSLVDIDKTDGSAAVRNSSLTYIDQESVDCLTSGFVSTGISLEKSTNGQDADSGPGPNVSSTGDVTWTYVITNTGNMALFDLTLGDDVEGAISCAHPSPLLPGDTTTCTHTASAQAGQYTNLGSITGTPVDLVGAGYSIDPSTGDWIDPAGDPADFDSFDVAANYPFPNVTASDPSHYFGANPQIDIETATNGQDADTPTGPTVPVGSTVTWTYVVTNPGNVPVANVAVNDDNGTPGNNADDFSPSYVSGDTNNDGLLDPTETWTYTATGTATAGQYNNDATVDGTGPSTTTTDGTTTTGVAVNDADPTHHIGGLAGIDIEKSTNGDDADAAPGPVVPAGGPVTWTYTVTNTGNGPLSNIVVTDDVEGPVCTIPALAAGASDSCTLTSAAAVGQYVNVATANATSSTGPVEDSDASHHFGANASIDIETATNGEDADTTDGPTVPVGETVTWTYQVTNTGNVDLANVIITDDLGGVVCTVPFLSVGETVTCTLDGVAGTGVNGNIGSVVGTPVDPAGDPILDPSTDQALTDVTDTDPTHHNGVTVQVHPKVDIGYTPVANETTGSVPDHTPATTTPTSTPSQVTSTDTPTQVTSTDTPSQATPTDTPTQVTSTDTPTQVTSTDTPAQPTQEQPTSTNTVDQEISASGETPGSLPLTGANSGIMALLASLMVSLGALLVIPTRRRASVEK